MVNRKSHARMPLARNSHVLSAFLCLLAMLFLLTGPASAAERTVGVIMTGDIQYYRDIHESFMAKLKKDGFGDTVEVIVQKPYPDSMSLSNAARKLIAHEVDVIIAYGTPAALAVSRERTRIPVVYAAVYEPVASKIGSKNVTGISSRTSVSSLLRYLRGMTSITNLGVIYNASEEGSAHQMKEILKVAEQYGIRIDPVNLRRHQDVRAAFFGKKLDALFITESSVASLGMASVMDYVRENRIPSASMLPDRNSRIIVTLFADPKELGEKSAEKTVRVLQEGAADKIKSGTAKDIELVFDLKELLGMGLKIPMDLVTEATRIIQ